MAVDYSALVPGQRVSDQRISLDEERVARYTDAVSDDSALSSACGDSSTPLTTGLVESNGRRLVPAMAVAALSLGGVINALQIPGGTLHAGQELVFLSAVPVGETLDCKATLVQNSTRGEWRFLVVQLDVEDGKGRKVMEGKSTIMVPA